MVDVKIKLHAKPTYVPCTRTCIYLTIRYTQIIYLCNIQPNTTVLTKKKIPRNLWNKNGATQNGKCIEVRAAHSEQELAVTERTIKKSVPTYLDHNETLGSNIKSPAIKRVKNRDEI